MTEWVKNWFSNFEPLEDPIIVDGVKCWTVESYFQSQKATDIETRRQLAALPPALAKKRARSIELRSDWKDVRVSVMEVGLRHKFKPGTQWHQKLLATVGPIVEWNNWGDVFWGVDLKTKQGENNLGKLLMKIRDEYVSRDTASADMCRRCGEPAKDYYGPYKLCSACLPDAAKLMQLYVEHSLSADDMIAGRFTIPDY
jgi:ribA/ribD-fused uncharacterized protein